MQNKHIQETSSPNIILKGHKYQPTYAVGWGIDKPFIASGNQNGEILVWNLENYLCPQRGFIMKSSSRDDLLEINN